MRGFSAVCAACFSELIRAKLICAALRRIVQFCSQKFSNRRKDREKFSGLPCALHRRSGHLSVRHGQRLSVRGWKQRYNAWVPEAPCNQTHGRRQGTRSNENDSHRNGLYLDKRSRLTARSEELSFQFFLPRFAVTFYPV